MKMTGAEITIRLLERQGIRAIAGIPGGANLPLYDALSKNRRIHHVLARHEQGAGFIAQGMARVTGTPQVCFATSGPGVTNMLTAIADAKLDSIPFICITGQVPRAMIGTDAFQEVDTYGLSIPITKHNFLVRSADRIVRGDTRGFSDCRIRATRSGVDRCAQRRAGRMCGVRRVAGAGSTAILPLFSEQMMSEGPRS